jgi:hypothetical protein
MQPEQESSEKKYSNKPNLDIQSDFDE